MFTEKKNVEVAYKAERRFFAKSFQTLKTKLISRFLVKLVTTYTSGKDTDLEYKVTSLCGHLDFFSILSLTVLQN